MGKKLDNLFVEWRKKQEMEVDEYEYKSEEEKKRSYLHNYYNKKSLLKNIDIKKSFTTDGLVDDSEWEKGSKILFILKEANIEGQLKNNKIMIPERSVVADNIFEDNFWFKSQVNGKINWRRAIFRRLYKVGKEYTKSEDFTLKSVAYMNINKRGGLNSAKEEIIEKYLEHYKREIKEEIRIINPYFVAICCGNQAYVGEIVDMIEEIKKEVKHNIEVKLFNHPAIRVKGLSDEKYILGLKN